MIRTIPLVPHFFFFNDTATTEIYTLSLQRRSSDLILEDSPASYRGPQYTAMSLQARRMPEKALEDRSEEHTSELQSPCNLVCRLLLEKKTEIDVHPGDRTPVHHVIALLTTYGKHAK